MTDVWRFYQRHADTYDRERSGSKSLMERPYLDAVTSRLRPGAAVLDLGCGTGEPIARHLIESAFDVTGVDAAPAMIALCRARFPNATWIDADMRSLALQRRFDAIIAWDSFFHLAQDEQRAMFPVFERHMAPGGVLLFTSGPRDDAHFGTMYGEELFHSSLAPDEYRMLLASYGFRVLRFTPEIQTVAATRSGSHKGKISSMAVDFGKTASDYAKHRSQFAIAVSIRSPVT